MHVVMEITVVGGGIAGLAAAICLAKSGYRVRVLERSPDFQEPGAGLQLGPNGVKALEQLGAWTAVDGQTFAPKTLQIMDAVSGEAIRSFSFEDFRERFGAPYRVVHRRDLHNALMATARSLPGVKLLPGHEVTALTWSEATPVLTLAGGEKVSSLAVVGADGLSSVVRQCLLADGPPVVHAQAIYRALIPRVTAPALSSDVVLWLYPGGHVVHYPVSGGRDINIVAVVESSEKDERQAGDCSTAEVVAGFAAMSPDLRYILGLAQNWSRWTAADRPPAKRWGKGPATLIGDAAHPMLPTLAQGAVAALQDAVALGSCVSSSDDFPGAFRRYEILRSAHTAKLQKKARNQAELYHWRGWRSGLRNWVLKNIPQSYFFSRIAWIYVWNHHPVPDSVAYTPSERAER
jgi:2-polyprenyl-6-methoxyphenol hydroxylase-like FAD-dependent oxidoreductase